MSSIPSNTLGFLSGGSLSMGDARGFDNLWVNPGALGPRAGLWNANPPSLSNPNPPSGASNPNPPSGASNPNPPHHRLASGTGAWPEPSTAPSPRLGGEPAWVYADPAGLLAQALRKSRARLVRPADGALQVTQLARSFSMGSAVGGSMLWRWAPEFRSKTVAGELLSRFQVQGTTLWLLAPFSRAHASAPPVNVFELPAGTTAAGVNMDEQVDKVMRAATEREDRLPEILSQMLDFWPFFESITGLPLDQAPRTTELLAATHDWMLHVLMQLKHGFAALRPVQRFSLVMPAIPTPGHGSLPSGHATMAAYTSELLYLLLYRDAARPWDLERADQLDRLARRIAFNRVVAGVHFPVDSMAGYALGTQMARLTSALAGNTGDQPEPITPQQIIRAPFELEEVPKDGPVVRAGLNAKPSYQPGAVVTLQALWAQAQIELNALRV